MAENILDRSENYLRIFNSPIEIDKSLPKWKRIEELQRQDKIIQDAKKIANQGEEEFESDSDITVFKQSDTDKIDKGLEQEISFQELLDLNTEEFNLFVSKRILRQTYKDAYMSMNEPFESLGEKKKQENFIQKGIRTVTQIFRKWEDSFSEEEVVEFDAIQFFDEIKKLIKDSEKEAYVNRLKPYLIALRQANLMSQKALSDSLIGEIFKNKYESLLYASDFKYKVSEEQLVYFVKRAEKGIRLDYIKNFARPVPEEVFKIKQKADSLMIFDNFCVLYYDEGIKSFKATKEEEEALRRKRADPILFGMISGFRTLFYITDWIDEYCNLTLEEFVKVAGLDKKSLEISEKIKL